MRRVAAKADNGAGTGTPPPNVPGRRLVETLPAHHDRAVFYCFTQDWNG